MTPHVGGIHLAQLRMMERIATKMGDQEYAAQCRKWLEQGSKEMESKLWTGKYYLSYYEPESGKKSELVFGYQLDGDWMCFYHGLPGVFQEDRARTALEAIKQTCVALSKYGAVNFANADGTAARSSKFMVENWGYDYGSFSHFDAEVYMLASTYLYQGQQETGLELGKRCMTGIVDTGKIWSQPAQMDGLTGETVFGVDYYQNLMLWSLPAAIEGKDLKQAIGPGSLVDRIIRAGRKSD